LFKGDPILFNSYSNSLMELGVLLNIAETALTVVAIIHVGLAIRLRILARRARPISYAETKSKMGPSKLGFASRNLVVTGLFVLVFLVLHIIHFKYGADIAEGYVTTIQGKSVRDLHRLVVEEFKKPWVVAFYVPMMVFLGFHLKHGVWSSFQSLGLTNSRTSTPIFRFGIALSCLISIGFIAIPLWIYFAGANP